MPDGEHIQRKRRLVVAGHGMVGHRLLQLLEAGGGLAEWDVDVFCAESRPAYDRVRLTSWFAGRDGDALNLVEPDFFERTSIALHLEDRVTRIDRERREIRSRRGARVHYDALVLATGSRPFVPPIPGARGPGRFVYRTIDDLEAIEAHARRSRRGVVVGGGLLGLEAAKALHDLGLETHVVELAPRLMAMQLDDAGGHALRERVEALAIRVHTEAATEAVLEDEHGVSGLQLADGRRLDTDMVVFSAGIRARDELAREAGLAVGPRGGVVVDHGLRTSDPNIFAIGECACFEERTYGLVNPGYAMARVLADRLTGGDRRFEGADTSTKLKLLGVDVASIGDAQGATHGARAFAVRDEVGGTYKRLVVSADGKRLLGAILVGDAGEYADLHAHVQNESPLPAQPGSLVAGFYAGGAETGRSAGARLPERAQVCSCNDVSKADLCRAVREGGCTDMGELKRTTQAGTGCGGCLPLVKQIFDAELGAMGVEVNTDLCEHFAFTRQELYHLIRVAGIRSFTELIRRHGRGRGCEICKPAVASILAATWNEYVLADERATLQDTNDAFLANIQKDGTYSVVPRVPAGEITPDGLIALGQIAKKYDLYTKITGGQRIDMFGARLDQLPHIWRELIDAGFESGHAYGKALRTVKSCVGDTWCRFGVQDSVSMAIRIEQRYRGLRAPHKLKGAVSGCARECAEAQSKDFGVIATEKGWNLYVCGNGGQRPAHAQLLAGDIDGDTLIRTIDRFLMFYIRTADKLQRTARWLEQLDGRLDYLRDVVVHDSLGIGRELEAQMQELVDSYRCEWKATVEQPEQLERFRHFVNTAEPDPSLAHVVERRQRRPARAHERSDKLRLPLAV